MTLNKIMSEASATGREQFDTEGRGQRARINKAMNEFQAEENETWNLQVSLIATAFLSIVYMAVSTFS